MQSYDNASAIIAAAQQATDPQLKQLLNDRVRSWTVAGVLEMTHLLIVEPGDTEQDLVDEVTFSLLVNPFDKTRYGSSAFQPWWDWLQRHDGWFELVVCVGNSGFAFELLIADDEGVLPALLQLCREYAQ